MYQARFVICLAFAAGAAALALQAQVREVDTPQTPRVFAPWEDGIPVEIDPDTIAGGGDPGCLAVGGIIDDYIVPQALRGNVYRITKGVTVTEIAMRLTVPTQTALHVGVFQRLSSSSSSTPYTRHPDMPNDVIIDEPAEGELAFQRTGLLDPPLALQAGYDYLIAFAWGQANVTFARDIASYPGATPIEMTFGVVRGSISQNNVQFPDGNLQDSITLTTYGGAAHAMQLCVAGSCCTGGSSNPQCRDISRIACQRLFGDFTSEGVTCADLIEDGDTCPLTKGACCLSPENCITTNRYVCEGLGGNWNEGVFCNSPTLPCALRGGCCIPGDPPSCAEALTEDECDAADGTWLGVDGDNLPVLCIDASPPCEVGACCEGIGCSVKSEEDCIKVGGEFLAPGRSCVGDPCIPRGACCNPQTLVCTDDLTPAQCATVAGRVYRGDGTVCEDLHPPCGKGACCTAATGCEDANGAGLTQSACQSITGTFRGDGTTCMSLDPQCPGICCRGLNFGVCNTGVQPAVCTGDTSGIFIGYGGTCTPTNPCSSVQTGNVGSCCLSSGDCVEVHDANGVTAQQLCEQQLEGAFSASRCAEIQCAATGACCKRDIPECLDFQTAAQCEAAAGEWAQGVLCDNFNPRCEPVGACCNRAQLTCQNELTDPECPPGSEWTPNARCSDLAEVCAPTGACCVPNGNPPCQENLTQVACAQLAGVYLGNNSVCGAESCIPTGACCVDGACSETTQAGCTGQYLGDGTGCASNTCATGACCNGSECAELRPADCDGTYAGDDTLCSPNLCTTGACCQTDCTCVEDLANGAACLAMGGQFTSQATCAQAGCEQGITGSDPADCAIDARQPHEPTSTTPAQGPTSITLNMGCATPPPVMGDFELFGTPELEINISGFVLNGAQVTLTFSGPIPPKRYTCVRHIPSGDEVCLGFLPGDVNNDGLATTDTMNPADDDVQVLTDFFKNGTPDLEMWQCDIDRSGACTALDIAREIDLLNGADAFEVYFGVDIGVCPSIPAPGACCAGEVCTDSNEDQCAMDSGSFRGPGTTCADETICAPTGACCVGLECTEVAELNCTNLGGTYLGDNQPCTEDICIPTGACCVDGGCTDDQTQVECDTAGGVYAGDDSACGPDTCDLGSCCNLNCECTPNVLGADCESSGGLFHPGESCLSDTCAFDVASSTPPHCAIDARQYQDFADVHAVYGLDSITVVLTCDAEAENLVRGDFFVFDLNFSEIELAGIDVEGQTVRLDFAAPLAPQDYACVEFDRGTENVITCVGFLPGDVNADLQTGPGDTLTLVHHLGVGQVPLPEWRCDIDRSGACTPLDILRHMDTLSYPYPQFDFWNGAQIDPCPFP